MKHDYTIRVLLRAAQILNCFTLNRNHMSLNDVYEETGLNKSTVFRILNTLEELKWVKKDPLTGTYSLGLALFELGTRALSGIDFYRVSIPHMDHLVKKTGQSVHLVVHDQNEVLYLHKIESPDVLIPQPSRTGLRLPMHCTAVGKVLLSHMSEKEVKRIIETKGLTKFTDKTIVDEKDLFRVLRDTRERGYAVDDEELQIGLRCVAAPIKDHTGNVVAAVSASGFTAKFNDDNINFIIESVVEAGKKISFDLGYSNHY